LRSPRVTAPLEVGFVLFACVLVLSFVGPHLVDGRQALVGAGLPNSPPSSAHWLGTDALGRDVLAFVVLGTWPTLEIGLIAGFVGLGVGLLLGLVAGYAGGAVDGTIRVVTDSLMTVPALAVLALIAANVQQMTIALLGLTVAALAWMIPARSIRAQVLTLRERGYLAVARANGERESEVLFRELMPNLLPYIAAGLVAAIAAGILAAIGLEDLGLGVSSTPTLGTAVYWAVKDSAVLTGEWWWWTPPIVIIAVILISLSLLSGGLDRLANPRIAIRT
jgi:peptide/nickel transport system permease protein